MEESCKWNTPLQISLDPTVRTIVGRVPAVSVSSTEESHCVILHSEILPYMLSEQHASLTFAQELKKWTIEDLEVRDSSSLKLADTLKSSFIQRCLYILEVRWCSKWNSNNHTR